MQVIPLGAVESQALNTQLGSQNCQISVYSLSTGLYLDLSVDESPIVTGVLCHDRNRLVRETYFGFVGDLSFIDSQGTSDPTYDGLGSRYSLLYLDPSDL